MKFGGLSKANILLKSFDQTFPKSLSGMLNKAKKVIE